METTSDRHPYADAYDDAHGDAHALLYDDPHTVADRIGAHCHTDPKSTRYADRVPAVRSDSWAARSCRNATKSMNSW